MVNHRGFKRDASAHSPLTYVDYADPLRLYIFQRIFC